MERMKRIYLQYLDESNDLITLAFRDEKSVDKHIKKLNVENVTYRSTVRPVNPNAEISRTAVINAIQYFEECYGPDEEDEN